MGQRGIQPPNVVRVPKFLTLDVMTKGRSYRIPVLINTNINTNKPVLLTLTDHKAGPDHK